eukprot:gene10873-7732_t
MLFTCDHLRENAEPGVAIDGAHRISIDDNFVAIDLFAPQPDRAVLQQAPSAVCSGCGALLHPHVTVVPETDFVSGRQWRCVFCDALHIADYDVRAAAEFQSQCFDVVLPAAPAAATGTTKPLHVALVDSRLLADEEDVFSFLVQCLGRREDEDADEDDEQLLGLVFFDATLRVPRLASLLSHERPVEIDVMRTADRALLQRGLHVTTRGSLRPFLHRLRDVVDAVAASNAPTGGLARSALSRFSLSQRRRVGQEPCAALDDALAVAQSWCALLQRGLCGAAVTVVTSQTLALQRAAASARLLQRWADDRAAPPVTLSLVQVGARVMHVPPALSRALYATGGRWLAAEALGDAHLLRQSRDELFAARWQRRGSCLRGGEGANRLQRDGDAAPVAGRADFALRVPNVDEVVVHLQLQAAAAAAAGDEAAAPAAPPSLSWAQRAMRLLHQRTQSDAALPQFAAPPPPTPTPGPSPAPRPPSGSEAERRVVVMVAATLPHCDVAALRRWRRDAPRDARRDAADGRRSVVRVWTFALPLRRSETRSGWTRDRYAAPLFACRRRRLDAAHGGALDAPAAAASVVDEENARRLQRQLTQRLERVTDALGAQLMRRLALCAAGDASAAEAAVALYEALWGLYGLRTGPLFEATRVVAESETRLLRRGFVRAHCGAAQALGLLRPRLWLLQAAAPDAAAVEAVEVAAETTQLLSPATAACVALFCGDRLLCSALRDAADDAADADDASDADAALSPEAAAALCDGCAAGRVSPAAVRVVALRRAGTGADRWLFARAARDGRRAGRAAAGGRGAAPALDARTADALRRDVALHLPTLDTPRDTPRDTRRFRVRRHLPRSDTPSLQRFVAALARVDGEDAAVALARASQWSQCLARVEALALRLRNGRPSATPPPATPQPTGDAPLPREAPATPLAPPPPRSERVELSDRGAAASDAHV